MSQKDKVRRMLESGRPVCSIHFLLEYIPRFGARIHELRADGMRIAKRPCQDPFHGHEFPQWEYQMEDEG